MMPDAHWAFTNTDDKQSLRCKSARVTACTSTADKKYGKRKLSEHESNKNIS